jgi:hypothetical protein
MGCTTSNTGELKYENILLPLPVPGSGWKTKRDTKPHVTLTTWQKQDEKLQLTILHGKHKLPPDNFRAVMDDHAQKTLTTTFESKTISEAPVNNYPTLLWETSATLNNGTKATTVALYIRGNDAAYLVVRSWFKATVCEEQKNIWINYLRSVKVIDTRNRTKE